MAKRIKSFIVPIFIPNMGCPHKCVFCNQKNITGQVNFDIENIDNIINNALKSKRFRKTNGIEVAFYGGTFTNLSISYITKLLSTINKYYDKGIVKSIRISTRPDTINDSILTILKKYNVQTVELGAQSLDNRVLKLSSRGHTAQHIINAFFLLKEKNFKVGIQLMPGLPGDNRDIFINTVYKVIELKPDMVRLYPTLVIKGTTLEVLYKHGKYIPLYIEQAVDICANALILFEKRGIPVIRIGLMNSESLLESIVAGPWHPSFGFLVRSMAFIKSCVMPLLKNKSNKEVKVLVNPNQIPLIKGYKNIGIKMIEKETGVKIKKIIPKKDMYIHNIKVEEI